MDEDFRTGVPQKSHMLGNRFYKPPGGPANQIVDFPFNWYDRETDRPLGLAWYDAPGSRGQIARTSNYFEMIFLVAVEIGGEKAAAPPAWGTMLWGNAWTFNAATGVWASRTLVGPSTKAGRGTFRPETVRRQLPDYTIPAVNRGAPWP